ncbi:MAG: hypothetical protein A3G23_01775 [Bacteroidetes bacterium RIFCSPLOWO2_12_FULL_37_12]|nr:MAG: hypothetical protein A3G23_01775 [Bacteroidetes bacterium RIFCSPLOWO2_12_FULL_37_12]
MLRNRGILLKSTSINFNPKNIILIKTNQTNHNMKSFIKSLATLGIMGIIFPLYSQNPNPDKPNDFQYVFIEGGFAHTVALRCNGTVVCWGENLNGQLGDNNSPNDADEPVVVKSSSGADSLTGIIAVAAGDNFTLALRADSTVWAWGLNSDGQLGDGSLVQKNFPVQVHGIGNVGLLTGVTAIAAGGRHGLAILANGTVVAWGDNTDQQLADGSNVDKSAPVLVTGMDPGTKAIAIAGGDCFTLVLQDDGKLKSCGCDNNGELGDSGNSGSTNTTTLIYVNTDQSGTTPIDNIIGIAAGENHAVVINNAGQVFSWGLKDDRLGRSCTTPKCKFPGEVGTFTTAIGASAGELASFVLLQDGTISVWGDNTNGELGLGDNTTRATPVSNALIIKDVRAVASGNDHTIVLLDDDNIQTFGDNSAGQLGNNSILDSNTPQDVIKYDMGTIIADAGPDVFYCSGDSAQIGGESPGDYANYKYRWSPVTDLTFPGTTRPDTLSDPRHLSVTATSTNYVLTKTYRNNTINACIVTDTTVVNVYTGANARFTTSAPGCESQIVNFYNAGSSGGGAVHSWDFGTDATPATSTEESPLGIVYSTSGSKIVTHTVNIALCGTSDTRANTITINTVPTASFTSTAPVCQGTKVDFTNTGTSGVGVTYIWDFGAGASPITSTAENPTGINYSFSGAKTVTLTVTNQFGCKVTTTQIIAISKTPVADFATTAPKCTGIGVDFIFSGDSSDVSYDWDFGGGSPNTSTSFSQTGITYATEGNKTVTLIADISGCSDTISKVIAINLTPTAAILSSAGVGVCGGDPVDYTYTGGTSGTQWNFSWDLGEDATPASSTAKDPTGIFYTSSGVKTITFTISDGVCSASATTNVTVNATPTSSFTSDGPACVGENVLFTNTGTSGATSYAWDFGSGASPATSNVVSPALITYSSSGNKTVTLTVINNGCTAVSSDIVTINDTPVAGILPLNTTVCSGTALNFTYNGGTTGTQWNYAWDFGDDAVPSSSTAKDPAGIYYSNSGGKTVTFTISDGTCSASTTTGVTVNATPTSSFTSDGPACVEENVLFTNTGTSGATSYDWDFGSGASPATSSVVSPVLVTYSSSGNKTVTLTVINNGCTAVSSDIVTINVTPVATFVSSKSTVCANDTVSFNPSGSSTGDQWSYNWDFGANASPSTSTTADGPEGVFWTDSGIKTVTYTITDGTCTDTYTDDVTVNEDPIATFDHSGPECTGEGVDFTYTGGTVGATYSWNFNGGVGTTTDQSPQDVTYATAGNKSVVLTVTKVGGVTCTSVVTNTLIINLTPTVIINSTKPILCAEDTLTFSKTGSSSGAQWSFLWDFGKDGIPSTSTTTDDNAVVRYDNFGTKNITLTISDATCTKSATISVDVSEKPVADFASTAPKCAEEPVDFVYTGGTSGISLYSWDFGDSLVNDSDQPNPAGIIFDKPGGNKTITFAVRKGLGINACYDTLKRTITIYEKPTSVISTPSSICEKASLSINKNGSSQGDKWTYLWAFGDAATPSTSTTNSDIAEVYYNTPGNKIISLTITDGICTETDTELVIVNEKPVADFSSNGPRCTGNTVNFSYTGGSTGNWNYDWDFKAGATPPSSTLPNPTGIVYSTSPNSFGIKNVELIMSNNNCSDTITHSIVINETPDAQFSSNAPKCEEEGVDFAFTGITSGNWKWSYRWDLGEDAFPKTSTAMDPKEIKYKSGGAKTITLTVFDAYCTNTISNIILINGLPVANAGEDTTICANRSVQIGDITLVSHSYSWFPTNTLNNGTISNPVSSPDAPVTQYIVTVKDNSTLCVTTDTVIVTMLSTLFANAGPDVEICFGDSIQIGNALMEGQNYTWLPTGGINKPTSPNPLVSPDSSTNYTITIDGFGCDPISDEVMVTVHPLPDAQAGADDSLALGESVQLVATGGVMYLWSPLSGLSNGGIPDPVASPSSTGDHTFIVKVTDMFGCMKNDTLLLTVVEPSVWFPNAFTPDENGKNDLFRVRGFGIKDFEFRIFSRWGEVVFYTSEPELGWDGTKQISHEPLPEGAYIYYVKGTDSKGKEINQKGIVNLIR